MLSSDCLQGKRCSYTSRRVHFNCSEYCSALKHLRIRSAAAGRDRYLRPTCQCIDVAAPFRALALLGCLEERNSLQGFIGRQRLVLKSDGTPQFCPRQSQPNSGCRGVLINCHGFIISKSTKMTLGAFSRFSSGHSTDNITVAPLWPSIVQVATARTVARSYR